MDKDEIIKRKVLYSTVQYRSKVFFSYVPLSISTLGDFVYNNYCPKVLFLPPRPTPTAPLG